MSFLATHSSIRSLYVSKSDINPYADGEKSILPNLHTISVTPRFMSGLAHKCDGLKYIHCLTLDLNDVRDFVQVVDKLISAVNGFPNLKHCSINRIVSTPVTAKLMGLLSPSSIELEYWTGGFYYHNNREFVSFQGTHVLSCSDIFKT